MKKQMYYLIHSHHWGSTLCVADSVEVLANNYELEIKDRTGWVETIHDKDYPTGQDAIDAAMMWHTKYEAMGYIDADALLYQ
jgi:hypothetical protein